MKILEDIDFPFENDTELNKDIFSDAVDKILQKWTFNFDYDIPYLCGYSVNGKIIYFDRHLPLVVIYQNKEYSITKALAVHESDEKANEDHYPELSYQDCHQMALRKELNYVETILKLPIDIYNEHCDKYIKIAGSEKLEKIPLDLDLKPYKNEEDWIKIKQMQLAQGEQNAL
jgi:hypothetical protein